MENKTQSLTPSKEHSLTKTHESISGREVTETGSTAAEMVAEQTRAEVYGAMTLAKKFPRDEVKSRELIIQTCESIKFADSAIYKKPIGGGKTIEGASIRLAEEILRNWGNVKVFKSVIYDDSVRRMIRVVCYDLQTNASYSEDAVIEKTVERKSSKGRTVISERTNSYGEKVCLLAATEDEMMIKEGAKTSKMIRNAGLRLIPQHIKEEAIAKAKEVIRAGLSKNIDVSIKKMVESFELIKVKTSDLEKYLNHPITQLSVDEIANLKMVYQTIKDGESKWSDYVSDGESKPETETAQMGEEGGEASEFFQKGDEATHKDVSEPAK